MTASPRALSFNLAAAQYAASRPSYPPALFDFIEEVTSRPLAGARVADIGAGTGIATFLLRQRGAEVIAVEPGDAMASQFHSLLPDVPIVRGDGNALPLADASHELITFAQSWQWTDTSRSVPEALRVLSPNGALAIWWNTTAFDVPWIREQHERIARHCAVEPSAGVRPDDSDAIRLAGLSGLRVARRLLRWSRMIPLDTHLANITSRSAFLVLPEDSNRTFRSAERRRLREIFPDEAVQETYVVDLLVAIRPRRAKRPGIPSARFHPASSKPHDACQSAPISIRLDKQVAAPLVGRISRPEDLPPPARS
ncbi:class I SAM-dependent methyltransferase [Nocardia sp. NPDC050412]|uniref:class I SAM-dependent methyltransferase n=1 Tax=Nocardia sp. NPDC050412 TaxID=3364320 RepID=UPI00379761D9